MCTCKWECRVECVILCVCVHTRACVHVRACVCACVCACTNALKLGLRFIVLLLEAVPLDPQQREAPQQSNHLRPA